MTWVKGAELGRIMKGTTCLLSREEIPPGPCPSCGSEAAEHKTPQELEQTLIALQRQG